MDDHGMDDAMDPHGMGPHGPDHHDLDGQGLRPDGMDLQPDGMDLQPDGMDLQPDGLGLPGPEPGLDDLHAADHTWPDDLGAGHGDHLDPDLATAETADLSFAEDYHGHHLPDDHDLHGIAGEDVSGGQEPLFGADPDLHPLAGVDLDGDEPFPPTLDLDPPEPIDGYPWTDPAVLGHDVLPSLDDATGGPDPAELFEYAGEQPPAGGDAWATLLASEDPATSALARWWSAPR